MSSDCASTVRVTVAGPPGIAPGSYAMRRLTSVSAGATTYVTGDRTAPPTAALASCGRIRRPTAPCCGSGCPGGQTRGRGAGRAQRGSRNGTGDGLLQLTSPGNLQLRGVPTDPAGRGRRRARRRASAACCRQPTHERVRNIAASPLTGLAGGEPTCGR